MHVPMLHLPLICWTLSYRTQSQGSFWQGLGMWIYGERQTILLSTQVSRVYPVPDLCQKNTLTCGVLWVVWFVLQRASKVVPSIILLLTEFLQWSWVPASAFPLFGPDMSYLCTTFEATYMCTFYVSSASAHRILLLLSRPVWMLNPNCHVLARCRNYHKADWGYFQGLHVKRWHRGGAHQSICKYSPRFVVTKILQFGDFRVWMANTMQLLSSWHHPLLKMVRNGRLLGRSKALCTKEAQCVDMPVPMCHMHFAPFCWLCTINGLRSALCPSPCICPTKDDSTAFVGWTLRA